MITRRQFCKAVGAGAIITSSPQQSIARNESSPFRATPNPRGEHFTIEDAKRCVANWSPDDPIRTQYLVLTRYKTASSDALAMLANRKWLIADFGLAEITNEIARAISAIPIEHLNLHHLIQAASEVVANIVSIPTMEIAFMEVESMNKEGILGLVGVLHSMKSSDNSLTISGNFLLNRFLVSALVGMPKDISLYLSRKKNALTSKAWTELSTCGHRALSVWISPDSFSVHSDYGKCSPPIIERWDDASGEIINIPFDTAYLEAEGQPRERERESGT